MIDLLGSIRVLPLYAQVVVESENVSDLPVPEIGSERVAASSQSLLVATRSDREGDVLIEVRRDPDRATEGAVVFDGELSLATSRLVVGSSLANVLLSVDTLPTRSATEAPHGYIDGFPPSPRRCRAR